MLSSQILWMTQVINPHSESAFIQSHPTPDIAGIWEVAEAVSNYSHLTSKDTVSSSLHESLKTAACVQERGARLILMQSGRKQWQGLLKACVWNWSSHLPKMTIHHIHAQMLVLSS